MHWLSFTYGVVSGILLALASGIIYLWNPRRMFWG